MYLSFSVLGSLVAPIRRVRLVAMSMFAPGCFKGEEIDVIAKLPTDSTSLLKILVGLLQPRELVSGGLSTLNKIIKENRKRSGLGKNKNKNRERKKTQESDMDGDVNAEHEGVAHIEENLKIEVAKRCGLITEIADRLVGVKAWYGSY
ncbi:hypothetical protein BKA69DRAFT_1039184 [Paraphysoderma sedebokerense]|nr:hypothetical protein BKA69DRAFT_1039184 [Paraphysoderma sedebokerense]